MAGYRDAIENAARSYARHGEYKSADRAYNKDYGALNDYRDGYQQGFETGYDTGYAKDSFDATIPTGLSKRGVIDVKNTVETDRAPARTNKPSAPLEKNVAVTPKTETKTTPDRKAETTDEPIADTTAATDLTDDTQRTVSNTAGTGGNTAPTFSTRNEPVRSLASGDEIIIIPADTEFIIELIDEIDTQRVREGDPFRARITSPYEISGAIIEGRVAKNRPPGKIKRRAELILSFDRIIISENRWSNFNAIITEVLPVKGDNVKRVDNEGQVEGKRPYKEDGIKIGAATGTGLIIGAVVGGPVGAAVGAGVGAAFGVGAAVVERGEYIKLAENQQLRIKTAYETQIR